MQRENIKIFMTILLAVCMIFGYTLVPDGGAYAYAAAKKATAKSITLNHKVYTVKKGKTVTLKATVLPKKAANSTKIVWKTSNNKIATVSSKGKVKSKKAGKVTITATVKGTKKKAKCTIYVGTPVKNVTLDTKALTLTQGETYALKAKLNPSKPKVKTITYISSKKTVATVTSKGVIKAVGKGTCYVYAYTQNGVFAKIKVTVK